MSIFTTRKNEWTKIWHPLMELNLRISPPKLLPWLASEQRRRTVLLLDAETDLLGPDCLRIDLNIVFNPIAVRMGTVLKADYFVGSTGAEIFVEAVGGRVSSYSGALELNVDYTNATTHVRKSGVSLSPEVKSKSGSTEESLKLGEISWGAKTEREHKVSFSCSEMTLVPIDTGNAVRWRLDTPKGEKAVRDFLIGNLFLFAECTWKTPGKRGRFGARPSDIRFFDDQRRALGKVSSYLMLYRLWRKGLTPMNEEGFDIAFAEVLD